jgi:hypothetical protein
MLSKIDVVLDTVNEQVLVLDKDIDKSTLVIHNKMREVFANLPEKV